jgi:hypothetical protein
MAVLVYKWDFPSDADGWTLVGSTWGAGFGDGDGGLEWACISGGGGCANTCATPTDTTCTRWSGTFESLGIPAGSTITKFLHVSGSDYTHMRIKGSGAGTNYMPRTGMRVYVDSTGFGYALRHTFFNNTIPGASWGNLVDSSSSLPVSFDSDDPVLFSFGHNQAIRAKTLGSVFAYLDEVQVVIEYTPPVATRRVFVIS